VAPENFGFAVVQVRNDGPVMREQCGGVSCLNCRGNDSDAAERALKHCSQRRCDGNDPDAAGQAAPMIILASTAGRGVIDCSARASCASLPLKQQPSPANADGFHPRPATGLWFYL
jgi:hypothetical protein